MGGLILSTIATSAVDSVNPVAISQQFVLQGMVKKPWHIWFFIVAIAITNMSAGLLAYFGFLTPLVDFFSRVIADHGPVIFALENILGIVLLIAAGVTIQNGRLEKLRREVNELKGVEEKEESSFTVRSVSPLSLTLLGVLATITELTSAMPYFAYLGILFNSRPDPASVIVLMILYNIIYSLPLILMYIVYRVARKRFNQFYTFLKQMLTRWSVILAPVVLVALGAFLVFHSTRMLMG